MNEYTFVFNCSKEKAIDAIFDGVKNSVIDDTKGRICGKIADSGTEFFLFYALGYRNGGTSKLYAKIEEVEGKTYMVGKWKEPVLAIGFILFWYGVIVYNALKPIIKGEIDGILVGVIIVLLLSLGLGFAFLYVFFDRQQRGKVIEHMEKAAKKFEIAEGK